MSSDWDEWQHDVAAFVLGGLRSPPCRVLDVGCGSGWLVRALHRHGYAARGVDPQAPVDDPLLTRARLEDVEPSEPFDVVVAVLPLHHVDDLELAVATIDRSLTAAGRVMCVEFAWDRFDDDTARWCLERLPSELDERNWLHGLCVVLRDRQRQGRPLGAKELIRSWANEHGFHTSAEILERLRDRFAEQHLDWGPYVYPDLVVGGDVERAAIEAGQITSTSFRFIGQAWPP